MKKILLVLFFLIAAFYAIIQGPIGRNWVRRIIVQAVQDAGYQIEIGRIDGTLPHQINLKKVSINDITVEQIHLRPVLWRLLKREFAFTDVHAKNISIGQMKPFDLDGKFRISKKKIVHFSTKFPLFNLRGKAYLEPSFSADLKISSEGFSADAHIVKAKEGFQGQIQTTYGKADVIWDDGHLQGTLSTKPFDKIEFDFTIQEGEKFWTFNGQIIEDLFQADVRGTWGDFLTLSALSGTYNQAPFTLVGPVEITWTDEGFTIPQSELILEDSSMIFSLQKNRDLLLLSLTSESPKIDIQLSLSKRMSGHLFYEGRIEKVLDFINLGPNRLTADALIDLHFKNSLTRPLVSGKITLENGLYENYYTGTTLKNLSASFAADKNTLFLQKLTATDEPGSGTLSASGHIDLLAKDHYPFRVHANFTDLKFVQIDLVEASARGEVHIEGNTLSALATGDVLINQSELTIPDHIPKPLPDLKVVYRNPTRLTAFQEKQEKPYPLFLNINVSAPKISIAGRGLDSKWKGDFHLGGTYTALSTQGEIDLIEGAFNFSSRSFKLTEGALLFSGKEHQMPQINLSGTMETKGVTIIANLHGPLDNPQITLHSSPPLPLGSIMSYLLFGQDVSEIGGFQALQIASSLASFAGTGPDVMESARKSLGIDRLSVVTDESGESVALQVGKYVTEGVLVTFTQGTDESSTNISVEIDLKRNFIFQIESDQRQEQGRFTLKWSLNY